MMQSCDVYCLPSYGEPFGMTALEAMACARPVVATDAGGLRHLVPDEGGRKVAPGDPRALAAALRELLTDQALRRAMGEHNRRLVEERYAWPRIVSRLEEVYGEAIREPSGDLSPARWRTS
jgi:L-malate glycosyltransferase